MNFIKQNNKLLLLLTLVTLAIGCKYNLRELSPKAKAGFSVTPISGQTNRYLLTSSSTNTFMQEWDKGDGKGFVTGKAIDTAYFPDKGAYTVRLLAYGHNGIDTASQSVVVANDDPAAITPEKLLTGNSTKTWILEPGAGALWVGDPGGGVWWQNGVADVTAGDRTCLFNDEYTFVKGGAFVSADKGDMRVDDEAGAAWPTDIGLNIGCYNMSQIPTKYKAWGSGNFTFKVIGTNKLQVLGTGAHLGLYKVGENGTTANPESSITYDILELTANKLVVRKLYSWGQWRFTFRPK